MIETSVSRIHKSHADSSGVGVVEKVALRRAANPRGLCERLSHEADRFIKTELPIMKGQAAMSDRIDKTELIERIAKRSGNSAVTIEKIVDAMVEEIYEALKQGECITLKNLGSFYVRSGRENWVFKFNPAQRLRKLFGWSSTYKGEL